MAAVEAEAWRELVRDKKKRQLAAIPKDWIITPPPDDVLDVTAVPEQCGLLSPREIEITGNVDIDILLKKLASGEWSAVEVTTAYYKRAIVAHQVVNCLTEIFVDQALARAAKLDAYLKETGKVVGPLHGLPISLKDQLAIKGLETTMGYVSWIGKYSEQDAVLVEILYELGAVPFVRTNVPQTLMWPETFNNIFGRTTNPYNRTLTSGGSSGGEGALIALKGSPLGIGSDIGGSVRIPASFCGLYGLRPSYHRIPYSGALNSLEGQDSLPSVLGPLSGSLAGVRAFMRGVIGAKPWTKDPLAVRKAWDEDAYRLVEHGGGTALCFAVMWDDGVIVPHPPVHRALAAVRDALAQQGHTVIDWKPLNHKELYTNTRAIWNAASAEDFRVTTSSTGEPVIATMSITEGGEEQAGFRPDDEDEDGITAYQLWQLQRDRRDMRKKYLDHWNATVSETGTGRPVDAIIAPTAPYAAPPHGKNRNANYTGWCNALDYPALVIPVTKVDETLDKPIARKEFLSPDDELNHNLYDPATFKNAPVNIQVVGRTLEEEAVIAMAEIVDAALKSVGASQL